VKNLILRVGIVAVAVAMVMLSFTATKTWACYTCGAKKAGNWYGNCFETNYTCAEGYNCEATWCVPPPPDPYQKLEATMCTVIANCAGDGDPKLPYQCSLYKPDVTQK
jgi:hypothetical protein